MHFKVFAAAAVVLLAPVGLAPAPAWAQSGEVEFHIEATATVAPDRATVPLTIEVRGDTEAKAKALLDKDEKALRKRLAGMGIVASQIFPAPHAMGDLGEVQARSDVSACTAAAEMSGNGPMTDAAGAAASAAEEAAADEGCAVQYFSGSRLLIVELTDVSKLYALSLNSGEGNFQLGKASYSQSDSTAAHRKARADAIAKARLDGGNLAEAMGYRIIGIKRVSNTRPGVSLPGLIEFISTLDGRSGVASQPSWFAGSVSESVMIDFVAAPK